MKKKYYIIKKRSLAEALNFLTGQRYYKWDNEDNSSKKVYSFEISDKFLEALHELTILKEKINNK